MIRSKLNENANIIFGSSIDENLDGIINISVLATGINQTHKTIDKIDEITNQAKLIENEEINQTKLNETKNQSSNFEGQIDLESKIADLNKISYSDNTNRDSEKNSLTFLETKEKELSDIFNKKDEDPTSETQENQFLKKISNLFSNNKNKNATDKLLQNDEVYFGKITNDCIYDKSAKKWSNNGVEKNSEKVLNELKEKFK